MKCKTELDTKSIIQTITVSNIVATNTMTVDCCNCIQRLGQVTFSINSLYDSRKKVVILFIVFELTMARALGFEPRSKVLETSILPLNYTCMYGTPGVSLD